MRRLLVPLQPRPAKITESKRQPAVVDRTFSARGFLAASIKQAPPLASLLRKFLKLQSYVAQLE